MKKLFNVIAAALATTMILATTGCPQPNNSQLTVEVTSVTLSEAKVQVVVGKTVTVTATVTPENATNKTVTWTSDNAEVAKVENGVITGVKAGTAKVTAKAGTKDAVVDVTVVEASNDVNMVIVYNKIPGVTGDYENTTIQYNKTTDVKFLLGNVYTDADCTKGVDWEKVNAGDTVYYVPNKIYEYENTDEVFGLADPKNDESIAATQTKTAKKIASVDETQKNAVSAVFTKDNEKVGVAIIRNGASSSGDVMTCTSNVILTSDLKVGDDPQLADMGSKDDIRQASIRFTNDGNGGITVTVKPYFQTRDLTQSTGAIGSEYLGFIPAQVKKVDCEPAKKGEEADYISCMVGNPLRFTANKHWGVATFTYTDATEAQSATVKVEVKAGGHLKILEVNKYETPAPVLGKDFNVEGFVLKAIISNPELEFKLEGASDYDTVSNNTVEKGKTYLVRSKGAGYNPVPSKDVKILIKDDGTAEVVQ